MVKYLCKRSVSLKSLTSIFLAFFLFSCAPKEKIITTLTDFKEKLSERVKAKLSQVPLVSRWVKLPPPPKELYQRVEEKISLLKLSKAKDLYKEEYDKVLKLWEEAKENYKQKYYRSAEKKLKTVLSEAEKLLVKVEEYEKNLRARTLLRYKTLEDKYYSQNFKGEEEKIKARLYLFKLKNLIELGYFDEFEKEAENPPF